METLEAKPVNATHWSSRQMAAATGLSRSTVSRIWRTFGLQPWRSETFKLSTDPLFVVGLYLDLPEWALVLCVDEKSQIQALGRSHPVLPMQPGVPERRTHNFCVPHNAQSVRRAGRSHWHRHQLDSGQLRDPQDPGRKAVAAAQPPLQSPRGSRRYQLLPRLENIRAARLVPHRNFLTFSVHS